jgi:hypothetical protein
LVLLLFVEYGFGEGIKASTILVGVHGEENHWELIKWIDDDVECMM